MFDVASCHRRPIRSGSPLAVVLTMLRRGCRRTWSSPGRAAFLSWRRRDRRFGSAPLRVHEKDGDAENAERQGGGEPAFEGRICGHVQIDSMREKSYRLFGKPLPERIKVGQDSGEVGKRVEVGFYSVTLFERTPLRRRQPSGSRDERGMSSLELPWRLPWRVLRLFGDSRGTPWQLLAELSRREVSFKYR